MATLAALFTRWNNRIRRRKFSYITCAMIVVFLYYFIGIGDYLFTRDFDTDFKYPLDMDILPLINQVATGQEPSERPINYYPYKFRSNSGKCRTIDKLDLVLLVKSAMDHFTYREAIRKTWGQEDIVSGKTVKLFFFLGINDSPTSEIQTRINAEMSHHNDIIQIDFIDSYFNNTIKTMMTFRWAYEHCPIADYYLFADDDMYISVPNVLEFAESRRCGDEASIPSNSETFRKERDDKLFAGYIFKSVPHRIRSSKWRVSLEEYPWNRWPAYVTAGAYVVSNHCMRTILLGSLFVKHFRFDDVYLGIVAKKIGLEPLHCSEFYYYKKEYSKEGYRRVIASHGYDDHEELLRVWNEQHYHT